MGSSDSDGSFVVSDDESIEGENGAKPLYYPNLDTDEKVTDLQMDQGQVSVLWLNSLDSWPLEQSTFKSKEYIKTGSSPPSPPPVE